MKKTVAITLALIIVLSLFSACAKRNNLTDENGDALKNITICLDWTPNTNHTGLYVAQQKGFYAEQGLSVSIVQPPENGAALMCAAGQAQFAIDAQDTLAPSFASASPLEVTAVAALLQHNTSGIISRAGEGIDRPKGLERKTYSTWDMPTELAMIKKIVEDDGGNFESVNLIPNVITDEAGALKNRDTDAIWVFYGWGGINTKLSGIEFDYIDFAKTDEVFDYYTPVIIANNAFLKNDPETARAFLAATKKGYEFAVDHPDDAAEMLISGDTTGSLTGSEEFVKESQRWISEQYIADAEDWGIISSERWDNFYNWLWENKLIEMEIPSGTGFTNDYLS